nr:NADH dehydrogenase subunit 5 [Tripetaloceroides tonkinensis]
MLISQFLLGYLLMFFFGFSMFVLSLFFIFYDCCVIIEWEIFALNSSMVLLAFIFDWISLIFLSFVLFISSFVVLYSSGYMWLDPNSDRFIYLVYLFVLSMIFLIVSPNLISILLGWDGLGLVSYCLVIYYQNVKSGNAGMLTALSNRVGDAMILLSVAWLLNFGGWNYIYYYDCFWCDWDYSVVCFMVVLAGMTKSAQIPFSAWLPAAMAAPTPVSSLVHSSTLVTAGVYLLIRFSPMVLLGGINYYLLLVGCVTMLMSGLGANIEFDLKSVIALSTLSHLGFMISILSLGYPLLSFFHLLLHALFKALMFLCAGSYIHNFIDFQDIRFMGSVSYMMPYTSVCFITSMLSMCGLPFASGFYSSDLILESILGGSGVFVYALFLFSVGLSSMYAMRLLYYSVISYWGFISTWSVSGEDIYMSTGMMGLFVFSLLSGSLMSWLVFPVPVVIVFPFWGSMGILLVILSGWYLGYELSHSCFSSAGLSLWFVGYVFCGSMWFIPYLSSYYFSSQALSVGGFFYSMVDLGWGEYYGPQGLYNFFIYLIGRYIRVFDYTFSMYTMLMFILVFFIWGLVFYF